MARECGWTHEYIGKNLTLSQIMRYCETIHKLKKNDFVKEMEGVFHAVATAQGNLKLGAFKKYLDEQLGIVRKETINDVIGRVKQEGFTVEER